jgi:hypothetical protein
MTMIRNLVTGIPARYHGTVVDSHESWGVTDGLFFLLPHKLTLSVQFGPYNHVTHRVLSPDHGWEAQEFERWVENEREPGQDYPNPGLFLGIAEDAEIALWDAHNNWRYINQRDHSTFFGWCKPFQILHILAEVMADPHGGEWLDARMVKINLKKRQEAEEE